MRERIAEILGDRIGSTLTAGVVRELADALGSDYDEGFEAGRRDAFTELRNVVEDVDVNDVRARSHRGTFETESRDYVRTFADLVDLIRGNDDV